MWHATIHCSALYVYDCVPHKFDTAVTRLMKTLSKENTIKIRFSPYIANDGSENPGDFPHTFIISEIKSMRDAGAPPIELLG